MALVPLKLPKEGVVVSMPRNSNPNAQPFRFFFTRRVGFISGPTLIAVTSLTGDNRLDNTPVDPLYFAASLRILAPAAYADMSTTDITNAEPYVLDFEALPRMLFVTTGNSIHNLGKRLLDQGMSGDAERRELAALLANVLPDEDLETVLLDTKTGGIYDYEKGKKRAASARALRQVTIPAVGSVFRFPIGVGTNRAIVLPNIGPVSRTDALLYAKRLENKEVTERFGIPWSVYFSETLEALDPEFMTYYNDGGRTSARVQFGTAHRDILPLLMFDPNQPSTLKSRLREAKPEELEAISIAVENMFPRAERATLDLDSAEPASPMPAAPAVIVRSAKSAESKLDEAMRAYSPQFMAEYIEDAGVKRDVQNFDSYFNQTVRNYDSAANDLKRAIVKDNGAIWRAASNEERTKLFFTTLAARGFRAQNDVYDFDAHLYMLSMFCPKADPLGRYILCDLYAEKDSEQGFIPTVDYSNPTILLQYAGVAKKFILGAGGPKVAETDDLYPADGNESIAGKYLRMHSPKGVKVLGFGFGTVLYGGTAVVARMHNRFLGTYSRPYRSDEAEEWWNNAVRRGMAQKNKEWPERMGKDVTHQFKYGMADGCVPIDGGGYVYGDMLTGQAYRSIEEAVNAGAYRENLVKGRATGMCSAFEAQFAQWPIKQPTYRNSDMLPAINVMKAGLIPFIAGNRNTGDSPMIDPEQRSSWNSTASRPGQPEGITTSMMRKLELPEAELNIYESERRSEKMANMLARASFGPSPRLALMILNTLTAGHHDDLAKQYLARKDIAALIGSNKTAVGVLNSGRLSGFRNMSRRRMSHVLSGLAEGLAPSHDSENPLNIPPMPASIRRELDALAFD